MDIQKDYSCLERNAAVFSKALEAENDYQEALPAYCDDIYKVVKCVANNSITSAEINYNEVIINGKCQVCITYLNENSNLCFADFEEEFSKTVSIDNLSDRAFACAVINDKYTNFRVINQRRIDVHSSAVIHLTVYDSVKCPCISSCEDSKLRIDKVTTADVISSVISKIEFDEDFMIPADSNSIKRIISCFAFASITDTKIIKDKALIKAVVSLSVLYTTDTSDEEILRVDYSFNVSKIIDVSGIDENDIVISNINVSNVYLKAKVSSGDKMNVISAFGEVNVNSSFIREAEQDIISDGYVLNRRSNCSYSDYNCFSGGSHLVENKTANLTFDLSAEVKEIKEAALSLSTPVVRGNKLVSKVNLNAICVTDNDSLSSVPASAEIEFNLHDYEEAVASLSLQSFDYKLNQNGSLDARLNLLIDVYAYNNYSYKVLSDIEPEEDFINYPSLTVYFAKQKESLWSIAKSFSSDVELIARENNVSGDALDTNKVIIIPRV